MIAATLKACSIFALKKAGQSYTTDPDRTHRALTAPGVTTIVATEGGDVCGFQAQSDGEIQAHLSVLAEEGLSSSGHWSS